MALKSFTSAVLIVLLSVALLLVGCSPPSSLDVPLVEGASPQDVAVMLRDLRADPRVASVGYVSKEQALADFELWMRDHPEIRQGVDEESTQGVEADTLTALLVVTLRSRSGDDLRAIIQVVERHPLFDRLVDHDTNGSWIRYKGR